jgi:hypothetical protein
MDLFQETKTRIIIVVAMALVFTGILFFIYSVYMYSRIKSSYQDFFQQWRSQKIDSYILEYNDQNCAYTVKVNKGIPEPATSSDNKVNCDFIPSWLNHPQPMSALFSELIKLNKAFCRPNGCICDNINYLKINFDTKLGYIKAWQEINSGSFTPYITSGLPIKKACTLIFSQPRNFSVNLRPI